MQLSMFNAAAGAPEAPRGEAASPAGAAPSAEATIAAEPARLEPGEITPIQACGSHWLKRDDLFDCGGARGGKARALLAMLQGAAGVCCAGNRHSPMVSRVARVAKAAGKPARCHVAKANALLPQERDALAHGAELVRHKIGFLSNLCAKARADAEARGWIFVPLGVEGREYFEGTKRQVRDLPAGVRRIVVSVGSGMTAAAILAGLSEIGRAEIPVLGIRVGMDPERLIDRWAPPDWRARLEIRQATESFEIAAERCEWWGCDLDPHYEAKCAPFVESGDLFWITAIRSVLDEAEEGAAPGQAAAADAAPAWARGFPLAELREAADIFRDHDEGYAMGAFTAIKETHIAEARAAGSLRMAGGAAAIVAAARAGAVRDFADRPIGMARSGDVCIKRIAGPSEALRALLAAEAAAPRAWLEIWQERVEDREFAHSLGFRWAGSKIRASSEIVGVWTRGIPCEPCPPAEQIALRPLAIPALDPAPLAAAIARLAPAWADHYSSYNKRGSWSALALRGYGGRADFIEKPAEMSRKWKAEHAEEMRWVISDSPLRAALPEAEPLIAAIPGAGRPGALHRVRLMRLAAGRGELARHADITDPDAGTDFGRLMRIHIPIVTNEQVRFKQWLLSGWTIEAHMPLGAAWYLDTRKPHTAWNQGGCDRIHLVIDIESTPELIAALGAA